jgi:hypothetical protein
LQLLSATQVAALETSDIAVMSSVQVQALTTSQIVNLSSSQVSSLNSTSLGYLTTAQIVALETSDFATLSTNNLPTLTNAQLTVLTSNQVTALSTSQIMSLTSAQFALISNKGGVSYTASPIVLDLDGNGIQTLSVNAGVNFDLLANGQPVQTGWVGAGDGLLVLDRNQDGSINDGSELFGTSTNMADGSKAVDGYQALAQLDTNQDGVISSADAQFAKLGVWVDGNADGQTGGGEVKSLAELNIAQLSLSAQVTTDTNNGNLVGLTSSYQTTDGVVHTAADVWFAVKAVQPTQSAAPTSTNRLAQAIGSFEGEAVAETTAQPSLANALNQPGTGGQLASTVQMVEAMRAFAAQDAGVRIAAIGLNTTVATASSLAVAVVGDEKVKTKNSTDAAVSGLFLNK